jgi:putative restriction endonuclease
MFVGMTHVIDGTVRYQFQTWGGTRSPESRITDGFQPLYQRAIEGDVVIFQRRSDSLDRFRLILVKQGTKEFSDINTLLGTRRWGALYPTDGPVTQQILAAAAEDLLSLAQTPFQMQRQEVPRVETRQTRIARNSVFRESVRREYGKTCAVSGIVIATPTFVHEVESAHIVPISERGTDDVRNGMSLCQSLHWAFDRGLFGVLPDRTVYIPRKVSRMPENAFLMSFKGRIIREAQTMNLRAHADAFRWHLDNRVRQWD